MDPGGGHPFQECCVCGLHGQSAVGFTPISDILPSKEGVTTETITKALGVELTEAGAGWICEGCHLRIFNFKTFVLESSKKKAFSRLNQGTSTITDRETHQDADGLTERGQNISTLHTLQRYNSVPDLRSRTPTTTAVQSNNVQLQQQSGKGIHTQNFQNLQRQNSVPALTTGTEPQAQLVKLNNATAVQMPKPFTNKVSPPRPSKESSVQDKPLGFSTAQSTAQVLPVQVPASRAARSVTPLNLPTGTVMLQKENSSVYILPNGSTIEVVNQVNTANLNQDFSKPRMISSMPAQTVNVTSHKICRSAPARISAPIVLNNLQMPNRMPKKNGSTPVAPSVIVTDKVQTPTLLLPLSHFALPKNDSTKTMKSGDNKGKGTGSHIDLRLVNKEGKRPIQRMVKPSQAPRAPPMLLPKVSRDVPKLQCPKCGVYCLSGPALRTHLKTHADIVMCPICETAVQDQEELVKHMQATHGDIICPHASCMFVSIDPDKMKRHVQRKHAPPAAVDETLRENFHQCNVCGKTFEKATYLKLHKKRHASERQLFHCNQCTKVFKTKLSLRYHLKFHELGFHHCTKCDKKFQLPESLRHHQIAMHSLSAPYSCDICNQRCADRQSKAYHMKTHNKELHKNLPCPVKGCRFRGYYEYRIRRHIRKVHKDYAGSMKITPLQQCPFCNTSIESVDGHLKQGVCQLQLQSLVTDIVSKTSDTRGSDNSATAAVPGTQQEREATSVLQEYRNQLTTGQQRECLDTLTRNDEFIKTLMNTVNKLRQRLSRKTNRLIDPAGLIGKNSELLASGQQPAVIAIREQDYDDAFSSRFPAVATLHSIENAGRNVNNVQQDNLHLQVFAGSQQSPRSDSRNIQQSTSVLTSSLSVPNQDSTPSANGMQQMQTCVYQEAPPSMGDTYQSPIDVYQEVIDAYQEASHNVQEVDVYHVTVDSDATQDVNSYQEAVNIVDVYAEAGSSDMCQVPSNVYQGKSSGKFSDLAANSVHEPESNVPATGDGSISGASRTFKSLTKEQIYKDITSMAMETSASGVDDRQEDASPSVPDGDQETSTNKNTLPGGKGISQGEFEEVAGSSDGVTCKEIIVENVEMTDT